MRRTKIGIRKLKRLLQELKVDFNLEDEELKKVATDVFIKFNIKLKIEKIIAEIRRNLEIKINNERR